MGWWIVLGAVLLLGILPVGILAHYDSDGAQLKIVVGSLRLRVYPRTKKPKQNPPKTAPKPAKQSAATKKPATAERKSGGSLTDFMPLLKQVLEFLVDFRSMLRVSRLELKVALAGEDPYKLAMNYGRGWAAIGALDTQLERLFWIKKKELSVTADFLGTTTTIYGHLELTITVGRLLRLAIRRGIRIVPVLYRIQSIRKGGVTQ